MSEIEAGAHLDFVALLAKGLLDGPVEVAPGVDDEEVLDHGEGAERSRRRRKPFVGYRKDSSGWKLESMLGPPKKNSYDSSVVKSGLD